MDTHFLYLHNKMFLFLIENKTKKRSFCKITYYTYFYNKCRRKFSKGNFRFVHTMPFDMKDCLHKQPALL